MEIYALVVASGRSKRMGENKLLMPMGDSTVIEKTLSLFSHDKIAGTVLVYRDEQVARLGRQVPGVFAMTRGGEERGASVLAGLQKIPPGSYVLVHDGARPFLTREALERALEAAQKGGCFFLGVPLRDTIKVMEGERVVSTPPRASLMRAQTPQGAPRDLLLLAYERALEEGFVGTDDCSVVERIGVDVVMVPGEETNIKITYPEDRRWL